MLTITTGEIEVYDESDNSFRTIEPCVIKLEHSLYAISKWESKFKKPFLDSEKSVDEFRYYVECMILDEDNASELIKLFSDEDILAAQEYLEDSQTATVIKDNTRHKKENRFVTSELVYYWMAGNQIPFEADRWNYNRLMTLIQVCSIESQPKKKMKKSDILRDNYAKNMKRRAALKSRG